MFSGKINCLILAGQRSGDPLSEYFHLPNKAFIPLLGKPLIEWVLDALNQSNCFRAPIISVSSSQENLFVEKLKDHEYKLLSLPENSSRLDGVFRCLKSIDSDEHLFITTSDNPLLTAEIIDSFLNICSRSQADLIVGTVNGQAGLIQKHPEMRRTWHKLNKDIWLSGANLFYWSPKKLSSQNYEALSRLERQRKSPLAFAQIIAQVNLLFFCKLFLHQTSLKECNKVISQTLGIQTELALIPAPEACIDVDKLGDLEIAEQIMMEKNQINSL